MAKSSSKQKTKRCPICGQIVTIGDTEFPFCSDRCRTIDLGKWASGAYRISSSVLDPDMLEEVDESKNRSSDEDDES